MGAYEDQPGHVDVVEQEAPPAPVRQDGGTAVPGLDEAPVASDDTDEDDEAVAPTPTPTPRP